MMLNNHPFTWRLSNVGLHYWIHSKKEIKKRLFICASGYEKRCASWVQRILKYFPKSNLNIFMVLGFKDFPSALSRPANDIFYQDNGLEIQSFFSNEYAEFKNYLISKINEMTNSGNIPLEIHIDYSCMPRVWYCNLPFIINELLRPNDNVFFWYTAGRYPETEYPTTGIEDFHVFSGMPSLNPPLRTHNLGLGFDRIR